MGLTKGSLRSLTPPQNICFPFEDRHMGGSYIATLPLLRSDRTSIIGRPCIVTHNSGPWTRELSSQGFNAVQVTPLTMPGRDGNFFACLPLFLIQSIRIARFLYRNKIKIVHANEESVASTWLPACRLTGTKLIWHQHGLPTQSRFIGLMRRHCDSLLAVSEFIDGRLRQEGRKADIVTLNPFEGVYHSQSLKKSARAKEKSRLGISTKAFVIAFAGSLNEQKRPRVLISAAHHLSKQTHKPIKFLIFGDDRGITANELKPLAETYNLDLDFMGYRPDLNEWLKAVDILAAPAVHEGFGRVLVEAMLAGAVVVAADSGGHRDIIVNGINGLLSPKDNPEAMGDALLQVIQNVKLQDTLAQNAFFHASQKYLKKNYISAIHEIYRAV